MGHWCHNIQYFQLQQYLPFTVLKPLHNPQLLSQILALQQYLPFTVLKHSLQESTVLMHIWLQQYLPFTVLKQYKAVCDLGYIVSCNSTYRLWYAPQSVRQQRSKATMRPTHCKYLNEVKVKRRWLGNSTYRSRYWNPVAKAKGLKV